MIGIMEIPSTQKCYHLSKSQISTNGPLSPTHHCVILVPKFFLKGCFQNKAIILATEEHTMKELNLYMSI